MHRSRLRQGFRLESRPRRALEGSPGTPRHHRRDEQRLVTGIRYSSNDDLTQRLWNAQSAMPKSQPRKLYADVSSRGRMKHEKWGAAAIFVFLFFATFHASRERLDYLEIKKTMIRIWISRYVDCTGSINGVVFYFFFSTFEEEWCFENGNDIENYDEASLLVGFRWGLKKW